MTNELKELNATAIETVALLTMIAAAANDATEAMERLAAAQEKCLPTTN
jgi:hypothetical protein